MHTNQFKNALGAQCFYSVYTTSTAYEIDCTALFVLYPLSALMEYFNFVVQSFSLFTCTKVHVFIYAIYCSIHQPIDRNLPPLTEDKLVFEFSVRLEIAEDDGKGNFTPAVLEKDCFKLRQNVNKKVTLSVTQGGDQRPIIVER